MFHQRWRNPAVLCAECALAFLGTAHVANAQTSPSAMLDQFRAVRMTWLTVGSGRPARTTSIRSRDSGGESTPARTRDAARRAAARYRPVHVSVASTSLAGEVTRRATRRSPRVTSCTRSRRPARSMKVCSGGVSRMSFRTTAGRAPCSRCVRTPARTKLSPGGTVTWIHVHSGSAPPHSSAAVSWLTTAEAGALNVAARTRVRRSRLALRAT